MSTIQNSVYPILFNGAPLLVTPIGEQPTTTFLVDFEQIYVLLEKHADPDGVYFWTEYGKGITLLSSDLGRIIEEKNKNRSSIW